MKTQNTPGGRLMMKIANTLTDFMKVVLAKENARKLLMFLTLNFVYMFAEIIVGYMTNSLGLISDAGHMFFDCAALVLGLIAEYMSTLKPDDKFTLGYGRFEVLAGFLNGVFLLFVAAMIFTESVERLSEPPELNDKGLLATSIGGFFVNLVGVVFFHEHAHAGHDHGHSHHAHGHHAHGHKEQKRKRSERISHSSHNHGHSHSEKHSHGEKKHSHHSHHSHSHVENKHHSHGEKKKHSHHSHGEHNHEAHKLHGHGHAHEGVRKRKSSHHKGHGAHEHCDHHEEAVTNENMAGVYLHILADLLGSVGVIISSTLIQLYGWNIADTICSLCITVLIVMSVIPLLTTTTKTLLLFVNDSHKKKFKNTLNKVSDLEGVLHIVEPMIWKFNSSKLYCSAIVVVKDNMEEVDRVALHTHFKGILKEQFGAMKMVLNAQICTITAHHTMLRQTDQDSLLLWDSKRGVCEEVNVRQYQSINSI